jgi:hypothetical protein
MLCVLLALRFKEAEFYCMLCFICIIYIEVPLGR